MTRETAIKSSWTETPRRFVPVFRCPGSGKPEQNTHAGRASSREHLLDRLARDSQFPGDVGLGEARVDEGAEQVAAFGVELLGAADVLVGASDC
jgi:hypothetical protein